MFVVTGSPTQAVIDALKARLDGDAVLAALIEGVYGHVSETARVNYPYLVLGQRHLEEGPTRSMGLGGGRVVVQIDGWSDAKGASEMHGILSRVRVLLERRPLAVDGFRVVDGSLTCEMEEVFDEADEDSPERRLYRGIQRWALEIDEVSA